MIRLGEFAQDRVLQAGRVRAGGVDRPPRRRVVGQDAGRLDAHVDIGKVAEGE